MIGAKDLATVLAEHGLGQHAAVLLAEEVTVANVGELSDGDLKELGIPLGPRRQIMKLFSSSGAPIPHAPGGPQRSQPSPLVSARNPNTDAAPVKWSRQDSGKKFACFLRCVSLLPLSPSSPITPTALTLCAYFQSPQGLVRDGGPLHQR
jgi:hypothetical protein